MSEKQETGLSFKDRIKFFEQLSKSKESTESLANKLLVAKNNKSWAAIASQSRPSLTSSSTAAHIPTQSTVQPQKLSSQAPSRENPTEEFKFVSVKDRIKALINSQKPTQPVTVTIPTSKISRISTTSLSKPREIQDSPSKPAEIQDPLSKPAEIQDSLSKPAEIQDSLSKPAEIQDSLSKPGEIQDSLSKPGEIQDSSPSEPAQIQDSSPSEPAQIQDSPTTPTRTETSESSDEDTVPTDLFYDTSSMASAPPPYSRKGTNSDDDLFRYPRKSFIVANLSEFLSRPRPPPEEFFEKISGTSCIENSDMVSIQLSKPLKHRSSASKPTFTDFP